MVEKMSEKYPVFYKGREWEKTDVHELFETFYHEEATLEPDGSVYVLGGDYVYPDGEIAERGLLQRYLKDIIIAEMN